MTEELLARRETPEGLTSGREVIDAVWITGTLPEGGG